MHEVCFLKMNAPLVNNMCAIYTYLIIFLLSFVVPHVMPHWDLAVANEERIDFFNLNGDLKYNPVEFQQMKGVKVLAYDSSHKSVFFSASDNETSIFQNNLFDKSLSQTVPRLNHETQGIAYDFVTQTLFWTDGRGHSIWRQNLFNESSKPQTLLTFDKDIPTGITISFCKRLLFWANSNHRAGSIDRSELDGSNHTKIIAKDIFTPLAVTIDEVYGKIYWTDDMKGIYYKIERSNIDGTQRELVVRGTNQEPLGVAVFSGALYWTDTIQRNIWTMSLMNSPLQSPQVFYDYESLTPYGIVAYTNGMFECDVQVPIPVVLNTTEKITEKLVSKPFCLNSGNYIKNACKCKQGFSGEHCEVSLCHNYCLNGGQCYLDSAGYPECQCLPGYKGNRCEADVCEGFCLNGGRCSVNYSAPLCSCGSRYLGQRCEISLDYLCNQVCEHYLKNTNCECNSTKSAYEESMNYIKLLSASQCQQQRVIIIFLICFGLSAMLVIALLTRRVCILRRRPRIKKRIIVNKGIKSQTPMTARPNSTEQCEITIENCCNMNICETPCFEPNLRSSKSSALLSKKTEDKKKLLKNMEDEFTGSDGYYS